MNSSQHPFALQHERDSVSIFASSPEMRSCERSSRILEVDNSKDSKYALTGNFDCQMELISWLELEVKRHLLQMDEKLDLLAHDVCKCVNLLGKAAGRDLDNRMRNSTLEERSLAKELLRQRKSLANIKSSSPVERSVLVHKGALRAAANSTSRPVVSHGATVELIESEPVPMPLDAPALMPSGKLEDTMAAWMETDDGTTSMQHMETWAGSCMTEAARLDHKREMRRGLKLARTVKVADLTGLPLGAATWFGRFREKIWSFMDDVESSKAASCNAQAMHAFLLVALVLSLVGSIPDLDSNAFVSKEVVAALEVVVDCVCIFEFTLRFFACPNKWHFEQFRLLLNAFELALEALPVLLYMLLMISLIASAGVYASEPRSNIVSLPQALWLSVVTISTVGYGDVHPVTTGGRLCIVGLIIVSVLYMAVPLGIIGGAFKQVWRDRDRILLMQRTRDRLKNWGYNPESIPLLFEMADADGTGEVDLDEFRDLIKHMKIGLSEERIAMLFNSFDEDGNGFINSKEFIRNIFPNHYLAIYTCEHEREPGSHLQQDDTTEAEEGRSTRFARSTTFKSAKSMKSTFFTESSDLASCRTVIIEESGDEKHDAK